MLFQDYISLSSQANTCPITSGIALLFKYLLDSPVKGRWQVSEKSNTIANHLHQAHLTPQYFNKVAASS